MNEDAFARRFYADRSELESLRIQLTVERPADGAAEQENYSLRPENFHLPRDRLHRQGARGAADRAEPARRRIRLRRAAAPGAAADHLGASEPAARARAALGRARHHRVGRRPRALGAAGQGRDGDLPQQDDRLRLLHDGARRGQLAARWTPTTCCSRAASSTCSATRTSARRSACSACRGSAARSPTRPRPSTTSTGPRTSTRAPTPTAPTGSSARSGASRGSWSPSGSPGRSNATSAATARSRSRRARRERRPTLAGPRGRRLVFATGYSNPRSLISWVLGLGANARLLGPRRAGARSSQRRLELLARAPRRGAAGLAAPSAAATPAPARRRRTRSRHRAGRDGRRGRGLRAAGRGDPPRALRAPGDAREHPDRRRARRASGS